jgi:uncharacterized membrane protein SirB2
MFSATHPLQLVLGLILWSLYFVLVYSGLSIACAVAPPDTTDSRSWINALLLIFTIVVTVALLFLAYRQWRISTDSYGRFIARVAAAVYFAAAISTLAVGLPVIALPPCV